MQATDLDKQVQKMELRLAREREEVERRKALLLALPNTVSPDNVYSWRAGDYHAAFKVDTFEDVAALLVSLPPEELVYYRNGCAGFVPEYRGEGEIREIAPACVEVNASASGPLRYAPEVTAKWFIDLPGIGEVMITAVVEQDAWRFSYPRSARAEYHSRVGSDYILRPVSDIGSATLGGANQMTYASGSRHLPGRRVFYWDRLTESDPGAKSTVPAWLFQALPA